MATRRPFRSLPIPILFLTLAAGCGPGAPAEGGSTPAENGSRPTTGAQGVGAPAAPSGSAPQSGQSGPQAAARMALPGLFSIMVGLEEDMARVSRGLWIEDFDTIAAGADAVADHPRVPAEEFQRISDVLGPEMSRFGAMDQEVHDLAVRLSEAADEENLERTLSLDAELRTGCVGCHSAFRGRLRAALANEAPSR